MIEYIQCEGRKLNLASEASQKLKHLFSIDSVNVLIGANGSGKTRLLLRAAEFLTSGALLGDEGSYSMLAASGESQASNAKSPPVEWGVVYYTPIPYRRKVRTHRNLIDASIGDSNELAKERVSRFKAIASDLNVNARLTGVIGYSQRIFSSIFYSVLIERATRIEAPHINEVFVQIQELRHQIANTVERKNGPAISAERKLLESRKLALENEVQEWKRKFVELLKGFIMNRIPRKGDGDYLSSLSALEHILRKSKHREDVVQLYLEHYEIAVFRTNVTAKGLLNKWFEMAFQTKLCLDTLQHRRLLGKTRRNEVRFLVGDDVLYQEITQTGACVILEWQNLSSGLLALVEQFSRIDLAIKKLAARQLSKVLVLIDEGDAFLHLDWQRQYILLVDRFFGRLKKTHSLECLQLLIASHSPVLAADLPTCMVASLDSDIAEFKTFAAPLDDIIFQSFGSNAMGEFAATKIREIYGRAQSGNLDNRDKLLVAEIGDLAIQNAILGTQVGEQNDS